MYAAKVHKIILKYAIKYAAKGDGCNIDLKKTIKYFEKYAAQGNIQAKSNLDILTWIRSNLKSYLDIMKKNWIGKRRKNL